MAVYKEKYGDSWRVIYRYTDWRGERKQSSKRGFATKREAVAWETEQLNKLNGEIDMNFSSFAEIFLADMKNRVKAVTFETKCNIIRKKLIPYFGKRQLNDLQPKDVIAWQNELLNFRFSNGKGYSPTYLKSLHNQLSAVFNHAIKYYGLKSNPAAKVGSIGKSKGAEMLFWTKDEYVKFSNAVKGNPMIFCAFETLYWTGIREGELLALTAGDLDFEKKTVSVNKTFQVVNGTELVTPPKTVKSVRTVKLPDFLCEELRGYINSLYGIKPENRVFPIKKNRLLREMDRGSKSAGVKRIRIHDLRHSHVSLLIELGFSAVAIAKRVGHESIDITLNYAHMFPNRQDEMADKLNMERSAS